MKRHALFVGVNAYDDKTIRQLRYSIPDASVLADRFKGFGYSTRLLADPTGAELKAAVMESTEGLGSGDVFLFFFAGHGFTSQDGAHLLFCRDDIQRLLRVNAAGIRVDAIEALTSGGGFHRAFLLDSCRTDSFANVECRGGGTTRDLDFVSVPECTKASGSFYLLRSCDKFRPSLEFDAIGHGLFTQGLLDAMDVRDNRLVYCDTAFATAVAGKMEVLQRDYHVTDLQRPSIGDVSGPVFSLFDEAFLRSSTRSAREDVSLLSPTNAVGVAEFPALTGVQLRLLDKARDLLYKEAKCADCRDVIEKKLPQSCQRNDEVLSVLLPALLECDESRAEQVANAAPIDSLAVGLYRIDQALRHGDLSAAERHLLNVERLSPNNILVSCRRIAFDCAVARELNSDAELDQAEKIFNGLEKSGDVFMRSWLFYAENLIAIGRKKKLRLDDEELLWGITSGIVHEGRQGVSCAERILRSREVWRSYWEGERRSEEFSMAMRALMRAVDLEDAEAMCDLGIYYENEKMDGAEASKWYRTSADYGCIRAMYELGTLLWFGDYVKKDSEKGWRLIVEAAEQGCTCAQGFLGDAYWCGDHVEKSWSDAVKWNRAAVDGRADDMYSKEAVSIARYELGLAYLNGRGVAQSREEAIHWLVSAVRFDEGRHIGSKWANDRLEEMGVSIQGNRISDSRLDIRLAEQKSAEELFKRGLDYLHGNGVARSDEEAAKCFLKASEFGRADAQCILGTMYYNGRGVVKSYEDAVKWFHCAAIQGRTSAQLNLGLMYEHGLGVNKSSEKAIEWYQKAADQGNGDARARLAELENQGAGDGGDPDKDEVHSVQTGNENTHPASDDGTVDIYVGNLSYDMTEDQLRESFSAYGKVVSARLITNRFNGKSKGFGFVQMSDRDEAEKAVVALNGKEVMGRTMTVNVAARMS